MKHLALSLASVALLAATAAAGGKVRITEYAYKGDDGEFIEFTNLGDAPVDMTGWSFDDVSEAPGSQSLSGLGTIAPGQSAILCELPAATFAANWGLTGVPIVGDNANNLGSADEINLYDASNALVDRLTYGTGIATNGTSGWTHAESVGANTILTWQLSVVGDAQGSYAGAHGDVANPGRFKNVSVHVSSYGTGCAGSGGFVPALGFYGIPANGETVTLEVTQSVGGTTALLFLGTAQAAVPMAGGCVLRVTPILPILPTLPILGAGPGGGSISAPIVLTSAPSAFTLTMQAFTIDGGVVKGFADTNGVEIDFP